jgi:hypothetical protein
MVGQLLNVIQDHVWATLFLGTLFSYKTVVIAYLIHKSHKEDKIKFKRPKA